MNFKLNAKQSVAAGAFYIAAFTLISKLLGFFREILIADLFGTSWRLDAVIIALNPASLVTGVISGAIGTIFIPKYIKLKSEESTEARIYAGNTLITAGILYIFFGLILFSFPKQIISVFAPGFSEEVLIYASRKLRYLSILPLINGFQALIGGILRAERRFFQFAFSQLIFNIFAIPIIFFLAPYFNEASYVLAWIVGNLSVDIIMFLYARNNISFSFKSFDKRSIETLKLALPLFFSGSLGTINGIVDKAFVSLLPAGRVSAMQYANVLLGIISAVFINSLITSSYTELSEFVTQKKTDKIRLRMRKTALSVINISIPIVIWFVVMGEPLIKLIYQHGNFTNESAKLVAIALIGYSALIVVLPLQNIVWGYFSASGKVIIAAYLGILSIALNGFFDWIFLKPFGHGGIAASTSLVTLINTSILIWLAKKEGVTFIPWRRIFSLSIISLSIIFFTSILKNITSYTTYLIIGNSIFMIFSLWSVRDLLGYFARKAKSHKTKQL